MITMTKDEYLAALSSQGVKPNERASVCPMCGTVQSMKSLELAGCHRDRIASYYGFSCVGRWTEAGEHKPGTPPGKGCNWTLGGFLRIHKLEVVDDEGNKHPRFEVATPEQAQELARQQAAQE